MVQTRHYDQRPFDENVCDAIIANSGVKNCQKRCKKFEMEDASNMVQSLVACAMQGIRFSSINRLRWGGTKETGNEMKVCAMYNILFTRMNYLWLGNTMEMVSQIKGVWYTGCGSLGWTVCVDTWEQKWFKWTRCVWYVANRSAIRNVCEYR